jgi:hypothetical protein
MATHAAHGREIVRWFDFRRRCLLSLHADGVILSRTIYGGWTVFSRTKPGVEVAAYVAEKAARVRRASGVPQVGLRCACAEPHNIRQWSKDGRVAPCPCPAPVTVTEVGVFVIDRLPTLKTLQQWALFDGTAECPCGCTVEPDGTCATHQMPAWPRAVGLI